MAKSAKPSDAASKSAAKPRKTAAKKTNVLQMEAPRSKSEIPTPNSDAPKAISHQQVAELAHRFWDERGRVHGHDAEDWFRAEKMLRGRAEQEMLRGKAS
jgi:hypothetical protein